MSQIKSWRHMSAPGLKVHFTFSYWTHSYITFVEPSAEWMPFIPKEVYFCSLIFDPIMSWLHTLEMRELLRPGISSGRENICMLRDRVKEPQRHCKIIIVTPLASPSPLSTVFRFSVFVHCSYIVVNLVHSQSFDRDLMAQI
jgi:hypothetical protein